MWILLAIGSAVAAGLTAIFSKAGIRHTDPDAATALRTAVVFFFAWLMAWIAGDLTVIRELTVTNWVFLILSGLATGASWICYFKALTLGPVSQVAAVDKSSTILTVLAAMIFLKETSHLTVRLVSLLLLGAGIYLMTGRTKIQSGSWMLPAVLSAVFAAATSILSKLGMNGVPGNLATAIRTTVVLAAAWLIVLVRKKSSFVPQAERKWIILAGLATGISWLCYYNAIGAGIVSVVVPIDKLSILVTVILSRIFFGEHLDARGWTGLALLVAGTLVMTLA